MQRSDLRLPLAVATSFNRVLRRPVETALDLSLKYSVRLEEAKIGASVGSVGDGYDNALAETVNGLYKGGVIEHEGPWSDKKGVEMATLNRVHWYNEKRLFGPPRREWMTA